MSLDGGAQQGQGGLPFRHTPPCPACTFTPPLTGAGASRYAQIDVTAMETAHRVGAQHAQARQERLWELEQQQRRSGAPH